MNSPSAIRSQNDLESAARLEEGGRDPGEEQVFKRVTRRLVPLLFICYVIAYVDRINVGFAKLHLQSVLGVDPKVFSSIYGFGAGLFFIGYFIFEVPSNLILHRVGARVWIARIMIVWGLVSMSFMFMKGVTSFYVLRFLLGAAEAGFFPGIILYFTFWYPPQERARIIALFAIGGVAAGVVGSSYGYEMWLPSIVKALSGKGDALVGAINAIPYFVAGVAMYLVGRHSDKTAERRAHVSLSAISATIGFAIAATSKNPYLAMAGLTLAFAGLKSTIAPFWAMTTAFLSGTAAAGGIALINSVGNLGGFFGPTFVGLIKDRTGSDFGGLALMGSCLLGMGVLVFLVPRPCGACAKK